MTDPKTPAAPAPAPGPGGAPRQVPIQLEISEKEAEGIYTNWFLIQHTQAEVIIDCGRFVPNSPKLRINARLLMTPFHAKLLANILEDNLKKYEAAHGPIKVPGQNDVPRIGF